MREPRLAAGRAAVAVAARGRRPRLVVLAKHYSSFVLDLCFGQTLLTVTIFDLKNC
eukprot:COSAG01_NODE_2216_length_8154_cov_4.207945_1_plen_56_part_00